MADLPEIPRHPPRHWLEYVSTFVAVVISLVSLWVAIETEVANRQMVAASSWPLLIAQHPGGSCASWERQRSAEVAYPQSPPILPNDRTEAAAHPHLP